MARRSGRLTAHDSVFLYWERPEQPMHVAECMLYDGHITAADVVTMIGERIHLLPRYVQKVIPSPFGLAHPKWIDDPDFVLANHVEEREVPAPGDDRALSRVAGELFCELLDRGRPLWRVTVLHVIGVEWATWITANPQHLARTLEVVLNRLAGGVLHMPEPHLVALEELPRLLLGAAPPAGLVRTVVLPLDVQPEQGGPDQPPGRSRPAVPVHMVPA